MIGDIPEVNWTAFAHHGEIEDGAEIFSATCDAPAPNMKFDRTIVETVIAIRHGKRHPSSPAGHDRSDFAALMDEISVEVRKIISEVSERMV